MGLPYGIPIFNHFCMIHPSDRQTDGQTDGRAIRIQHAIAICCCALRKL